jgi:hypothetical protein
MSAPTTAKRGAAIVLGAVLASGGLVLLFGDVVGAGKVSAFTQKHYLTLCIVVGTMLAFHVAYEAVLHRRYAASLGLAVIVLAGTGLIVYTSLGRQAEGLQAASTVHDDQLEQRGQLRAELERDRISVGEKRKVADKACLNRLPDHPKCAGARSVVSYYENSVKGLEARLLILAPPKPADAAAENFGESAAAFNYDKDKATALASWGYRYLVTLFFEFGTTFAWGYAFSPRWRMDRLLLPPPGKQLPKPDKVAEVAEVAEPATPNNSGNWGAPPGGPRIFAKQEAEADLLFQLALGKSIPSQTFLKERWRVDKGTVSKWLADWDRRELIPERKRIGHCKVIEATVAPA